MTDLFNESGILIHHVGLSWNEFAIVVVHDVMKHVNQIMT